MSIPKSAQLIVSLPPIRADHGARLDGLLHCSFETRCGRIGNSPKSNPTDLSAIYLRSDQNQRFSRSAPSPLSGLFASDIRFIDLDDFGKAIEAWSDHGIEMPEMDGVALTLKIRGDTKRETLPIIAVTALAGDKDRRRGLEAGINDYQPKLDREQVLVAVE